MISVNLNAKRIRVLPDPHYPQGDQRADFIQIVTTWLRSPWLAGDPPVAFCFTRNEITTGPGWTLEQWRKV